MKNKLLKFPTSLKRVLKTITVILLTLLLLVLLVPTAIYVPWVQRMVVSRTLSVLNDNPDNLHYDIGSLQLRFPLEIELWDVCLSKGQGSSVNDTLVYVHHLHTALDQFPWGEQTDYVVGQILVEGVQTGIDSSFVTGLDLRGSLDTLRVQEIVLNLDSNCLSVNDILLSAPHFAMQYAASDTVVEEEPDTTSSAPWQVALGALRVENLAFHYDQWRVDSLNLGLEKLLLADTRFGIDTLTLCLPHSHIDLSLASDLSYLNDEASGWLRSSFGMALAQQDIVHVVGEALPDLAKQLPDSADLRSRFSLFLNPDTLIVAPLSLSWPGYFDVDGEVHAVHPFDNLLRKADLQMEVALVRLDTLLTQFLGSVAQRGYQVPDGLNFSVTATEEGDNFDALLFLNQDTLKRLSATATYNLASEEYRAALALADFCVTDYVPDLLLDNVNLQLDAQGRHFDFAHPSTLLKANLAIDTLHFVQPSDSSQLEVALRSLSLQADKVKDSLQVHSVINFDMSEFGSFDSLRIDFQNSLSHIGLHVGVGDALVDVDAACDVWQLMDISDQVMRELDVQTTNKAFDINMLQRDIPDLTVGIGMKQDNPIVPLLRQQGVGFDAFNVTLTNSDSLRMNLVIDTLRYEGTQVAKVEAKLVPSEGNYDYRLGVLYRDTMTDLDFKLGVKARLLSDSILAQGNLWADTMRVLDFDGCLTNRIRADVYLASLPLSVANGFLGDDLKLQGTLEGHASLDCDSVDFNALHAAIWFDSASVWYEGCDMTLGLPSDSIVYQRGLLQLNHIRFMTSNGQPIQIDGSVDMRKQMDNPEMDLVIKADNAQLFSNKRRKTRGQFVYGMLPLSAQVAVIGALDNLKVTGQVSVPRGCDLTYFYEEDGSVINNSQLNDLVEFISFDEIDSTIVVLKESGQLPERPYHKHSDMDVNLKLRISPTTKVTAWLPTGTNDKAMIRGGGDLKIALNENGELQLSGGYNVSDGDINFKLPMLPVTKEFALTNESWLRWSGIVDQPELNLKATENVKCTINDAASGARVVKFVVSILIKGTLEDMDILFDCSAPEDANIQSELASLTEEERTKQALMLLIAQTYSGPSASASSAGLSSANAAMSNLINKELESLLTNKLKHTEINVGIDTYDPNGTGVQQTDYSLSVSQRFFNDRMRVTVGGKMSTGDEVQQDEGAVLSDVSLEWLIKADASQYARLFRHINYQSILEGQVIESGIGYVQKRDAFKFKHLFIRSRRKQDETRRAMLKKLQEQQLEQVREDAKKKINNEKQNENHNQNQNHNQNENETKGGTYE
ncbi:MAG: translocation/assembly module TamB domain-containing protein [Bacteroidales bacterium]|nr:translocation/assembly module TamB domain-containing protein [Bacteroidales bacterium]